MRNVNVKITDLLEILRKNRAEHRAIFEKALEGFRKEVIRQLERSLEDAKAGRRYRLRIDLIQPMDQTKEYDRAIGMLEMATDETIDLSEIDYACYVQDEWSWKNQFTASNSRYVPELRGQED